MAVIRTIQAQRGLDPGSAPSTRIDDAVGQGLQSLGGSIRQASAALHEMDMRRERMKFEMDEFRADQERRRFEDGMALDFAETQQNIDPSGEGFTETVSERFNRKADEFLAKVPANLQPKFSEIVRTSREGWVNKASAAELDQRNTWYRDGITKTQEGLQNQVFNDPSLYKAARDDGYRAIDASGLGPAEKKTLREAWDETLSLTLAEREVRDAEADPTSAAGASQRLGITTDGGGDAASLLRSFEGFRSTPYWDVTAHRIGYGSDTVTRADGSVVRVTKGMTITRADAERDLARRAKEFEGVARKQVGARAWGALPANAQAALVSVTYNYGALPASVVSSVKSGNIASVATSVEGLSGHNGGINAKRRAKEAAIIRGADIEGNAPAPEYASLALDKRLEVYDRITAAAEKGQTAAEATAKAAYDAHKGSMELGIETGEITSAQTILNDLRLTDAHKADLLGSLRTRQGDAMATADAVERFSAGNLSVDPYSTDGKKTVDNVWKTVSEAAPEQSQAALESLVRQSGTVPQDVINLIRRGLASENVTDMVNAAQTAQRIASIDPAALSRRDGGADVQSAADDFAFGVNRLNLSPEDAVRRMAEARSPEKKFERKALEPAADEFIKTLEGESVAAIFDAGMFSAAPDVGFSAGQELGIQAEYLAIARDQFFASNGDPEVAKNRAQEQMKRLYGVTNVTGRNVVMKHPPERYWPQFRITKSGNTSYVGEGASLDYARIQLAKDIRQFAPGIDMGSVQLVTTAETDAMVKRGEMPGYAVLYTDANGALQTIPGKLWRPDIEEPAKRQSSTEEIERGAEIDHARQMQNVHRQEVERQNIIRQRQTETGNILRGGPLRVPDLGEPTPRQEIDQQRQELFDAGPDLYGVP